MLHKDGRWVIGDFGEGFNLENQMIYSKDINFQIQDVGL